MGGRVVFGDESVPPWLRETTFGRVLMNANSSTNMCRRSVRYPSKPATSR